MTGSGLLTIRTDSGSTNEWIVDRLRRGLALEATRPTLELACCALEAWPWATSRRTARMLEISTGRWIDPETVARLHRLRAEDESTFRAVRDGVAPPPEALADNDR